MRSLSLPYHRHMKHLWLAGSACQARILISTERLGRTFGSGGTDTTADRTRGNSQDCNSVYHERQSKVDNSFKTNVMTILANILVWTLVPPLPLCGSTHSMADP